VAIHRLSPQRVHYNLQRLPSFYGVDADTLLALMTPYFEYA
jgi:hypothetical protein